MIANIGIHKLTVIQGVTLAIADLSMCCRLVVQSFWPRTIIIEDELSDDWDNNVTKLLTKQGIAKRNNAPFGMPFSRLVMGSKPW